jgi:hypothetical protein
MLFKEVKAEDRTGYCLCGCGQKTPIAKITRNERGDKKGFPIRYIKHHAQKDPDWKEAVGVWLSKSNWKGGRVFHQGYVLRHKNTFTQNEYKLLLPMFTKYHKRGLYILEHRALVALRMGRVLSADEFVRHLDGNRSNNKNDNLLYGTAKDNYNDHDSARKEVMKLKTENKMLRDEIDRLRSGKKAKVVYEISKDELGK